MLFCLFSLLLSSFCSWNVFCVCVCLCLLHIFFVFMIPQIKYFYSLNFCYYIRTSVCPVCAPCWSDCCAAVTYWSVWGEFITAAAGLCVSWSSDLLTNRRSMSQRLMWCFGALRDTDLSSAQTPSDCLKLSTLPAQVRLIKWINLLLDSDKLSVSGPVDLFETIRLMVVSMEPFFLLQVDILHLFFLFIYSDLMKLQWCFHLVLQVITDL